MSTNTATIAVAFGHLQPLLDWCVKNCQAEWHYMCTDTPGNEPGKYTFFFDNEHDYINFTLWHQ